MRAVIIPWVVAACLQVRGGGSRVLGIAAWAQG